ncbi:MAG: hypothetical protein P8X73_17485 [Ignavibacteriaceae bacterium]
MEETKQLTEVSNSISKWFATDDSHSLIPNGELANFFLAKTRNIFQEHLQILSLKGLFKK